MSVVTYDGGTYIWEYNSTIILQDGHVGKIETIFLNEIYLLYSNTIPISLILISIVSLMAINNVPRSIRRCRRLYTTSAKSSSVPIIYLHKILGERLKRGQEWEMQKEHKKVKMHVVTTVCNE